MVRPRQYAVDITMPLVETTPRAEVGGSGPIFPDAIDEPAGCCVTGIKRSLGDYCISPRQE